MSRNLVYNGTEVEQSRVLNVLRCMGVYPMEVTIHSLLCA